MSILLFQNKYDVLTVYYFVKILKWRKSILLLKILFRI